MKTLALLAAFMVATPSLADMLDEDQREACNGFSATAESIMNGRQQGVPIVTMHKIVMDAAGSSALSQAVVNMAYEVPRYDTAPYQQDAVIDFGNEMFLFCSKLAGAGP